MCSQSGILREDIALHVDLDRGTCPLVTVKCAYQHIGCYFQVSGISDYPEQKG